jgi:DNA polymerase-1
MKTLTIVDTFGFFFRSYYALPYLKNSEGFPTGLLTGFINFVATLQKDHNSDYLLFALDSKGSSFRKSIDPSYKENRKPPPLDLLTQLPVAIDLIKKMGFKTLEISTFEADDIIATVAKDALKNGILVQVVTSDKDLYQLVDDRGISIYDPVKRVKIDERLCQDKFGVRPDQIVDYLSIVGDVSDNIPGVKGVGDKGAKKLLSEYGSLDGIYKNIDSISNKRSQKLLLEGRESAYMSYKLATLCCSVISDIDYSEYEFPQYNPLLKITDELQKYEMQRVLNKIQSSSEPDSSNKFNYLLLDSEEELLSIVGSIGDDAVVAFDTETTSVDVRSAKIVGFSFCFSEEVAYYVPINHSYLGVGRQVSFESAKKALIELFTHKIVGQNLKYDLAVLYTNFGLDRLQIYSDTMVMGWLVDPTSSVGLDSLAKRYFLYDMVKFKDVVKKGEDFSCVDLDRASFYAAEDAWMSYRLYYLLSSKLDEDLKELASSVELDFINTLLIMERAGITIDREFFKTLLEELSGSIDSLTKDIYSLTSREFNINSPKQLGIVLFEELGLKKGTKTKSGYSTNERVLNSLVDKHPVVEKILEYREVYKLRSTYIEPLLNLALRDLESRVYTSFLQTGTSTGRLSSKNPNLQNIPTRSLIGKKIREGFIAKDGYKLVSIDYSQIELRLLAHFSQDISLVEAFKSGRDIHLETAIKIFGQDMAYENRDIAKSINFGLLYGMGSRKLSQTLGITVAEAKHYIDSYFSSFITVKDFLNSVVQKAKEDGYVKSLLGRKRFFNFESANAFEMASYEREAVNTLFQGSAADIIKLAMNSLSEVLKDDSATMLLQIHDELIFEVRESGVDSFCTMAKDIMQDIYKLRVPLACSVNVGDNWSELK